MTTASTRWRGVAQVTISTISLRRHNDDTYDWSTSGLLPYIAARLTVCRVVLQIPRARHARLVADKSLAFSYDTSDTPDFLVTC